MRPVAFGIEMIKINLEKEGASLSLSSLLLLVPFSTHSILDIVKECIQEDPYIMY